MIYILYKGNLWKLLMFLILLNFIIMVSPLSIQASQKDLTPEDLFTNHVLANNVEAAKTMLEANPGISRYCTVQTDEGEYSLINYAIYSGWSKMVSFLAQGPHSDHDPFHLDEDCHPMAPLHLAIVCMSNEEPGSDNQETCLNIIKILLDAKANPNLHIKPADKRDSDKWATPLCVAVGFNLPGVVRLLLKKGAMIEQANSIGRTPMQIAENKRPEVADILRQRIIEKWEKTKEEQLS